MIFGWVMAVAGALPVIFIPPRGFFVVYLTLPGWFLFTAAMLVVARDTVLRRLPEWAAVFGARPEQLALFAVLALVLVPIERHEKPIGNSWVAANYQSVRAVIEPLARGTPLRRGARVLFLEDPFDPGDWILSNMFRLSFHDETLRVDRVKEHPELAAAAATYDRVYVLDGKELRVISR
jgi:hypothetical protein